MRPINIIGVLALFGPLSFYSRRALICVLNGILFHTNENNNLIEKYDTLANTTMVIYTVHSHPPTIKYASFATIVFLINAFLYKNDKILRWVSDLIHVFGTHLPLAYALRSALASRSASRLA